MNQLDPDAPLAPIDRADDASRRARVRARSARSLLGALVLMAQPLLVVSAGALLGARFHQAPVAGLVGMLAAWALAWAALLAVGTFAVLAGLPALARPAVRPARPGRLVRALTGLALAAHVLVFVAGAAAAALACAWFGTGGTAWLSVPVFAAVGAVLAATTPLAEAG
ncbi:MAG TPA: hypothetical protein VFG18_02385 [Xanthomonadaceae bacterium]|nr:hypothetical protein [Xanthomonadaceae bacterium]